MAGGKDGQTDEKITLKRLEGGWEEISVYEGEILLVTVVAVREVAKAGSWDEVDM